MKEICGEVMEIDFDKKVKKLNAELAVTDIGAPVIILQDWTEEEKSTDLVTLHLKEAIELKGVIEKLILDATLHDREYVDELMNKYLDDLKEDKSEDKGETETTNEGDGK